MAAAAGSTPAFSADALNRYRLAHNDRDLRPVIRRLNKLPYLDTPNEAGQAPDAEAIATENELARLEMEKWKLGVERMLASARNLERQRGSYLRKAEETVARTEALKQTLAEEKALLVKGLAERDHRIKCDEVAKKIIARGKTRKELEEQIASLKASITEHRTAFDEVVAVGDARADTFSKIVTLVEECRALKLPASAASEPMDVDKESPKDSASAAKLSATTLPFQPGGSGSGSSQPAASSSASNSRAAYSTSVPNSRATTPVPYPLPSRPTRSTSASAPAGRYARGTHGAHGHGAPGLPPRPSNLRNARLGNGLEDGEVGEEDGEVKEGNKRRATEMEAASRTRRK